MQDWQFVRRFQVALDRRVGDRQETLAHSCQLLMVGILKQHRTVFIKKLQDAFNVAFLFAGDLNATDRRIEGRHFHEDVAFRAMFDVRDRVRRVLILSLEQIQIEQLLLMRQKSQELDAMLARIIDDMWRIEDVSGLAAIQAAERSGFSSVE